MYALQLTLCLLLISVSASYLIGDRILTACRNYWCASSRIKEVSAISRIFTKIGALRYDKESQVEVVLKNALSSSALGVAELEGDDASVAVGDSGWVKFPIFDGNEGNDEESHASAGMSSFATILELTTSNIDTDAGLFVDSHVNSIDGSCQNQGSNKNDAKTGSEIVSEHVDNNSGGESLRTQKGDRLNHGKRRTLLRAIKGHISHNRASKILNCLRDKTSDMSSVELNYLATDTIRCLGASGSGMVRYCTDILSLLRSMKVSPDIYTYTSAMSVLNKHRVFEDVLDIFDFVVESGEYTLDAKFFENAVRAAGHVRTREDVLLMLDSAYDLFGVNVLTVVHSALANLKYSEKSESMSPVWVEYGFDVLMWLENKGLRPQAHTFDVTLAVMCTHGDVFDAENVLGRMKALGIAPTHFTFNTILDRCAVYNHIEGALHVLETMRRYKVAPDSTTYNTLLKLCVRLNDFKVAQDVLKVMEEKQISLTDYAKVSMMRLYSSNGLGSAALDIVNNEPDHTVTSHMFVNAIKNTNEWTESIKLIQRANNLGKADESVFAAAAQCCFNAKQYEPGLKLFDIYQQKGFRLNKYMLSIVIGACLNYIEEGGPGMKQLEKYLEIASKVPNLLTSSVCQRVVKQLTSLHEPAMAASMHLRYLSHCTCSSDVLLILFIELQNLYQSHKCTSLAQRKAVAQLALAVVGMYAKPTKDRSAQHSSKMPANKKGSKQNLIRTQHFNRLLRMLTDADMYTEERHIFHLMKNSTKVAKTADDMVWKPTTFTIAELVRSAKLSNDPESVFEVMMWGLREAVLLPDGVISDSLSFLFSLGQTESLLDLYNALYDAGKINHWSDRDSFEMDLHTYSRGMAYAAISCALDEARDVEEALFNAGEKSELDTLPRHLTIITGRSERARESQEKLAKEAFVLSTQIQDVLVENFFPPIDSSTVPGNAGRLLVPYRLRSALKTGEA
jgi:pentatricopeptide repeat protein